ncbi:MAG: glycosyltransferase family 4 protein [Candidatus Omnitrophota bacterium]
MQPINLLYAITKLELGGAQKQLLSLLSCLDRDKFRPFLFTAKEGLLIEEACRINGITLKKSRFLERRINPVKDVLAVVELYRFIKRNNIAIVHTHSSKAGVVGRLAARLAGIDSVVHTVHGWSFNDYQPRWIRLFFIFLERICAQFSAKLIVVSRFDRRRGLKNRIGQPDKYTVISYGVDQNEFNPSVRTSLREELGIGERDLLVGMVACLKPQKSPVDFLRLAYLSKGSSPRVKFVLVGDGGERGRIERLIRTLNLEQEVFLLGWRKDIAQIIQAMDILVLTSLWEGLPVAILEAMACAKPIVATHTGGIEEVIIDGKTGFLVAPKDISGMFNKVAVLFGSEALRKAIGRDARVALGDGFLVDSMAAATQDLYSALLRQVNKCRG